MICRLSPLSLVSSCPPLASSLSRVGWHLIAAEVSATRLDGTTATGELRQWSTGELYHTPPGDQQIAANQLVSLRWQPPANSPPAADKNTGSVELIDGSILPIKSIQVNHSNATLTLASAEAPAANGSRCPSHKLP